MPSGSAVFRGIERIIPTPHLLCAYHLYRPRLDATQLQKVQEVLFMTEYLTPKDLAKRYKITERRIKEWRIKTRKGEATGPPFEDIGLTPFKPHAPRIRYKLTDVLSWEAANNIQPQSSN